MKYLLRIFAYSVELVCLNTGKTESFPTQGPTDGRIINALARCKAAGIDIRTQNYSGPAPGGFDFTSGFNWQKGGPSPGGFYWGT